ncbi:hypothetical protein ACED98_00145 [Streptococcus thoraltensis]
MAEIEPELIKGIESKLVAIIAGSFFVKHTAPLQALFFYYSQKLVKSPQKLNSKDLF